MSYCVYMPVILEELGFKVTERWFDEVEPRRRGSRGGKRRNRNGAWEGKEKAKMSLDDEELPPREERDTPPLPMRTASPTPILGRRESSDSRDSTPTPTSNTSSSTSTSATPLPPLNSDHIASPLPKPAGFDFAAIKAELRELSKGVGMKGVEELEGVDAVEAPRMRVGYRVDNNNEEEIIEEEPEEILEFGPLSSSSSPPPTPLSKSPNAGYFSFPPTTSNTTTSNITSSNTTGLTFGSADGERITENTGVGLPDPYPSDPWMVPGTDLDMGRSRTGDVGNPWG
ncbi:hypothetical protein HHX47_DHR1002012 [Lentinula edodes]|nr:hypothetical protein HHX47_DHR1002012 [Lentinula edodes]